MFDASHDILKLWTTHPCFDQPHKTSIVCFQTAFRTDLQKQYILPQSLRRKVATPPLCVLALKSFECKSEDKIQFVDEVTNDIEKDIEVLEDKFQSYRLQDQD